MAMRRSEVRVPIVLAFFIALSGACGGGDDGTPVEYQTVPGPDVPQPPEERRLSGEGECTITPASSEVTVVALLPKVEGSGVYAGRESGFHLEMSCGATIADGEVALYFSHGAELLRVERKGGRWTVNGRSATVVPSQPAGSDAGSEGDAGVDADADAVDTPDANGSAPPPASEFVNGVGLPGVDGARPVIVTLVASGVRYDIRAIIPWQASVAPATCQQAKPGTGSSGSSGGCGGGSSSKRSSGGDWD